MNAQERLSLYQAMHQLSSQMLASAQASAWDDLTALEAQVAALRERLMHDTTPPASPPLTPEIAAATVALIEQIQAHHEQVKACVQPHLDEIQQLLHDTTSRRRIDAAYGEAGEVGSGL